MRKLLILMMALLTVTEAFGDIRKAYEAVHTGMPEAEALKMFGSLKTKTVTVNDNKTLHIFYEGDLKCGFVSRDGAVTNMAPCVDRDAKSSHTPENAEEDAPPQEDKRPGMLQSILQSQKPVDHRRSGQIQSCGVESSFCYGLPAGCECRCIGGRWQSSC